MIDTLKSIITSILSEMIPTKGNRASKIENNRVINSAQLCINTFREKWMEEMEKEHLSVKEEDGSIYIACLQSMYTEVPEQSNVSPWNLHSRTMIAIIRAMDTDIAELESFKYAFVKNYVKVREMIMYYKLLRDAVSEGDQKTVKRTGDTFYSVLKSADMTN